MIEKKRDKQIDTAKGIGILLVLLGHSITNMDNPLNTIILSFHMPLFFVLSGMTLSTNKSFCMFVINRIKTIGSALLVRACLIILIDTLLLKRNTIMESINDLVYLKLFNDWFLVTLFISLVICYPLIKLKNFVQYICIGGGASAILLCKFRIWTINTIL